MMSLSWLFSVVLIRAWQKLYIHSFIQKARLCSQARQRLIIDIRPKQA